MRQRNWLILAVFGIFLSFAKPASAAQIVINNQPLDVPTVTEQGTTLVPLRAIFEELGANVNWQLETKTVTAVKDDVTITLQIDSPQAYRNDQPVSLQVPGKIIDGTTMVPLRFVSESMGAEVNWDSASATVYIKSVLTNQQFNEPFNPIISDGYKVNSDPLYNEVLEGLKNGEPKVTFSSADKAQYGDMNKIMLLTQQVIEDHPYLNYIESFQVRLRSGRTVEIELTFDYNFTPNQVKEMIKAVDQKAIEVINAVIKPGMTDLEKEKALHDYVVLNTQYDYKNYQNNTIPKESYTAYGVLINGVGVCQGYASVMSKLLNMVGIECEYITGTGTGSNGPEAHGWNRVKIDGKWYHLDTTWDDPVPDQTGKISYKYFNLTDEQMKKDHAWDKNANAWKIN